MCIPDMLMYMVKSVKILTVASYIHIITHTHTHTHTHSHTQSLLHSEHSPKYQRGQTLFIPIFDIYNPLVTYQSSPKIHFFSIQSYYVKSEQPAQTMVCWQHRIQNLRFVANTWICLCGENLEFTWQKVNSISYTSEREKKLQ